MNLSEKISKTIPRERSGATTSNRYNYQRDWSILRILAIHDTTPDYYLIFEHLDDIIQLDSNTDPKKINFYQVKTKDSGNWSLTELFAQKEKHPTKSPIALLLDHLNTFSEDIESLNLVTNTNLSRRHLPSGDVVINNTHYNIASLTEDVKSKIRNYLKKQISIELNHATEAITFFLITPLPIIEHHTHVIGHIVTYLNRKFGKPGNDPEALYKSLFEEISIRSSCELKLETLDQICRNKGISKDEVNLLLEKYYNMPNWDDIWNTISQQLTHENYSYNSKLHLNEKWKQIELHFIGGSDIATEHLRRAILDNIPQDWNKLSDLMEHVYQRIVSGGKMLDEFFVKALTLRVVHENRKH